MRTKVGLLTIGIVATSAITFTAVRGSGSERPGTPPAPGSVAAQPFLGQAGADLIVSVFLDFDCVTCGKFATTIQPKLLQQFGDRIRLVARSFPMTEVHATARASAVAAECAHQQNRFWRYADWLFFTVDRERTTLVAGAGDLGMDTDEFEACLTSQAAADEIEADVAVAQSLGVDGTPVVEIRGELIRGLHPYATFSDAVEAALRTTSTTE